MSRNINPFGLRMPPALRKAVEKSAENSGRSLNAEIVMRLRNSIEEDPALMVREKRASYGKLGGDETALIGYYRGMTPARRKAILELLKE